LIAVIRPLPSTLKTAKSTTGFGFAIAVISDRASGVNAHGACNGALWKDARPHLFHPGLPEDPGRPSRVVEKAIRLPSGVHNAFSSVRGIERESG
jgi:hypothetical protein